MKRFAAFLVTLFLFGSTAHALAPDVALTAQKQRRNFTFTLTPDSSADGCSHELYAAGKRRKLDREPIRGRSLITVQGGLGETSLSAQSVPSLRQRSSLPAPQRQLIFFRAVTTCGVDQSTSNITRLRFRRARRGIQQISTWLERLGGQLFLGSTTLSDVFPNFQFSLPVDIQNAGDGSNRLFIAEQGGRIQLVRESGASLIKSLYLDISTLTTGDGERGLLGFAFHPNYVGNGYLFVNYTDLAGNTVIARYTRDGVDPNKADPTSAAILFTISQPFTNHNGGGMAFGPDGFLYLTSGDGGSGGDPEGNGQDRTTLLGKILRVDVDSVDLGNYGIPAGNPFIGEGGGVREEIFAFGFRNPWRLSFDSDSGRCWIGDVGQDAIEEIDILESGGNFGWRLKEGDQCFNPQANCEAGVTVIDPVAQYAHALGSSITGGYVYRGSALPSLAGYYIFGDFIEGRIWALLADGVSSELIQLFNTELNISSFGVDEDQELYLASYSEGKVYKFEN